LGDETRVQPHRDGTLWSEIGIIRLMKRNLDSIDKLYCVTFNTAAGWVGLLASSQGLLQSTFPFKSRELAGMSLGKNSSRAVHSPEYFKDTCREYEAYFEGNRVEFSCSLDLRRATLFEQSVWGTARVIPYGQTQSYSWIARQIGKPQAPRAVGQALGRNPLPIIIPCHRILTSDDKLGGFGGGLDMKKYLLALEGNRIKF
jgi:methylated-DNA-[protein]-cysteine S-methyltransferase